MLAEIDDRPVRLMLPAGQPEQLLHGFLEAAPDAVVIVDGSGAIVRINSQTEKLFGYSREELIDRPLEVLLPERFRGAHVAKTRSYTADPHPRPMGRRLQLFGRRKDGHEFPIDVSISPLPPEAGVLVASTIRDMTSQRHLEDELRRRTRELEEADRQKDNFLSAVVHELRSPLAVLALVAQILRLPQADTAVREQTLGRLERQTEHMSRLVEDLLDLSRVRCGKVSLRLESVDLWAVFAEAVEMGQPLVESRRHRLEVVPFSEAFRVVGDRSRLVQILSNLITNAAKYTPEGGRIRLSASRDGGSVSVRVRDDGAGIPKEMLSRVFDLFSQVDCADGGTTGGLGIGLALVRSLVELHGGSVSATSDGPGCGSEFVLRLPLPPDEPSIQGGFGNRAARRHSAPGFNLTD